MDTVAGTAMEWKHSTSLSAEEDRRGVPAMHDISSWSSGNGGMSGVEKMTRGLAMSLTKLVNEPHRSTFKFHSVTREECNHCTIAKDKRSKTLPNVHSCILSVASPARSNFVYILPR
jgi:hypothetical protein